jgi:hypothetical protein
MVTRLKARFTTRWTDRKTPVFEGRPQRLTAKQVLAELADLKRGGTWVGVEAIDADGQTLTLEEIEELAESGPGRPVSTGSDRTREVRFRVSAAQRAELEAEATRLGLSSADLAARRRVFPAA